MIDLEWIGCPNCGDHTSDGELFCCEECRQEWDRRVSELRKGFEDLKKEINGE